MKKTFIVFLALGFAFLGVSWVLEEEINFRKKQQTQTEHDKQWFAAQQGVARVRPYPVKTAAYWTSPTMQRSEVERLAKHDIVIIDLENKFNNRERLLELKLLNPDIKLLVYSNPMEIFLSTYNNRPWQNKVINEIVNNRQQWLLKTIFLNNKNQREERYAQFWKEPANPMTMLNMSSACPQIKGEIYSEWMAKMFRQDILSDPIWDGYFQDNGTWNVSWIYPNNNEKIDINGDKKPDRDEIVDRYWTKGVDRYLSIIRHGSERYGFFSRLFKKKQNDFIIVSNKGDMHFLNRVDGKFFEGFPNDYLGDKWANGWRQCVSNAKRTGSYTIFQSNRSNINFVLASSLLLDNVYLAIGQDDSGIFPELESINLGQPLGQMSHDGQAYFRKFTRGTVKVWPLEMRAEIAVP